MHRRTFLVSAGQLAALHKWLRPALLASDNLHRERRQDWGAIAELIAVDHTSLLRYTPSTTAIQTFDSFQANSIPAFSGMCIATVRTSGKPSEITVRAS